MRLPESVTSNAFPVFISILLLSPFYYVDFLHNLLHSLFPHFILHFIFSLITYLIVYLILSLPLHHPSSLSSISLTLLTPSPPPILTLLNLSHPPHLFSLTLPPSPHSYSPSPILNRLPPPSLPPCHSSVAVVEVLAAPSDPSLWTAVDAPDASNTVMHHLLVIMYIVIKLCNSDNAYFNLMVVMCLYNGYNVYCYNIFL